MEDAVEKHRSLSMVKECTTSDEVGDDETLLDHLVKFTTSAYCFIVAISIFSLGR